MVACIYSNYGYVFLVTLVLWQNNFIHPFTRAVCAEVLCYGEHHPPVMQTLLWTWSIY